VSFLILNKEKVHIEEERLEKIVDILKKFGARKIAVFGSRVRGDFSEDSDIDLLVEFDEKSKDLGWRFYEIPYIIAEAIGLKVDLVTFDTVDPYIRPFIMNEIVVIYDEK